MNEIEQLSARLHALDPGSGRLDAETMLTLGRRRAWRRRAAAAVGTIVAVVALVATTAVVKTGVSPEPPAYPSPSTSPSPLPSVTSTLSCVSESLGGVPGGNPKRIVADPTLRFIAAGGGPAVRWDNGVRLTIPVPAGTQHPGMAEVMAINSSGVLVGSLGSEHPFARSYVYRDGRSALLTVPPGFTGAEGMGINARGDIVGYVERAHVDGLPAVWPAAAPDSPVLLPLPAGATSGTAYAIADDGTIVGTIYPGYGSTMAYEWAPNGIGHVLLGPTGDPQGVASQIRGQWIVGVALVGAPKEPGAVRWNRATGTVEVIDPDTPTVVMAASGAYLTAPGPRLIRGTASVQIPGAMALSDDGTRVVASFGKQVVIWHC